MRDAYLRARPLQASLILLAVAWFLAISETSFAQPQRVSGAAAPLPSQPVPAPVNSAPVRSAEATSDDGSSVVTASATDAHSRNLQSALLRAKQGLNAATIPNFDDAKRNLELELNNFRAYVGPETGTGRAWLHFLRAEDIRKQLEARRPSVAELTDLEVNMRQNYLGLEYSEFQRLRRALGDFLRAAKYGQNPERTIELLEQRIDALVEELNEASTVGSDLERSSQVGLIANYLHESQQVPYAVSEIRSSFSVPNIQIFARESLVNRFVGRAIAEPNPVNECILGTRVLGQACLSGFLNADVQPMFGGIALTLNMNATLTSQNRGYNRGVVLNTTGYSPVHASKPVYITQNGVSTGPSTVSTNLQTSINSIEHRFRIVRRIARRKAAEQKPQADAIAQGRMRARIQSQYDSQIDSQVAQAGGGLSILNQPQRPEMVRIGLSRPAFSIYSTDSTVNGDVTQAAAYQLSAAKPCTIPEPADSSIVVEAHQSAIINALDIVLGGRVIRSENLDDYAKQFTGEASAELMEEAEGEPWSITLAPYHPVELEFDDNALKFILRISQMTRGEQRLAEPAIISAVYRPSYRDGVLTLTRQGEVDIEFARQSRGTRVVTLRSFLKGKFDKAFKEVIQTQKLDFAKLAPNAPMAADFKINSIKIDNGWVQTGLR